MALEALGTDINGKTDFTLPAPIKCQDVVLTANVVSTVTTPANFNRAFFSYAVGTNVWVTLDGSTPTVPAVDGLSTQELNPAGRQISIDGGQTIKMISDSASHVNIRYDLGSPGAR
jgi:hypothetical protein